MSESGSGSTSGDEREGQKIVDMTYAAHEEELELSPEVEVVEAVGNGWTDMTAVAELANMTSLCLRNNRIGQVSSLEKAVGLVELDLYGNAVKVIEGVGHLAALESLDLSFNLIRSMAPLAPGFAALRKLYLCANKITRIEGLAAMPALEVLELGSNRIRTIEGLDALPALRELWLGRNKITAIAGLDALTNLEILDVQSNRLTAIAGLGALTRLTDLYLAHNAISVIDGVAHLTALETLDLSNNALDTLPPDALPLGALTELWLNHNTISAWTDVDVLKPAPALRTVYFEGNPIAEHPRYRAVMADTLAQITQLDATLIHRQPAQ